MKGVPADLALVLVSGTALGLLPLLPALPDPSDSTAASAGRAARRGEEPSRGSPRVVLVRWSYALVVMPVAALGFVWYQAIADTAVPRPSRDGMSGIFFVGTRATNLIATTVSVVVTLTRRAELHRAANALLRQSHVLAAASRAKSNGCRGMFFFVLTAFLMYYQCARFLFTSAGLTHHHPGPPPGPPGPPPGPPGPPAPDGPPPDPPPPPPGAAFSDLPQRLQRHGPNGIPLPPGGVFEGVAINYAFLTTRFVEAVFIVLCRVADENFKRMLSTIKDLDNPRRVGHRLHRLRALAAAYPVVVAACGDVTAALGPFLVMDTLQVRAEILLNLYYFVVSESRDVVAGSESLVRPLMSMTHLVIVSWMATRTANRCKAVLRELVKVDYTEWRQEERETMEFVTTCADTNQVAFNASGLVSLEMDLVVSVTGWTCSQLVVLRQANL